MLKRFPLKIHEDERGWLIQNDYPKLAEHFKHFLLSSTRPGGVRGNHYNKRKRKWFIVYRGKAELTAMNIRTKETEKCMLSGAEPELIQIDPYVTFKLENVGEDEMLFYEVISEPFDIKDTDTYEYKL